MIKINKVDVNDLDVLSRIDVDNFEDAWTKEMFKSELEHGNAEYYGWSQIYKYSNTKSKASNLWNSIKRFFSK